jgi:hypothetical protein
MRCETRYIMGGETQRNMRDEKCFVMRELRPCDIMRDGPYSSLRDGSELEYHTVV